MLSSEQAAQIKTQILQQIENFPSNQKEVARQQIEAMSQEELENFIKKNQIVKKQDEQKCVFCSINSGEIQSHKLEENKSATAIFEINPISRGHVIIIPKNHTEFKDKIPKRLETFAKKIAKKIKTKLKPKKVEIHPANLFGHGMLNVLPIYGKETIESERHKATPEELEDIQKVFEKISTPKPTFRLKKEKIEERRWLPKRIP